jgi:hypothetical protein
MYVGPQVFVSLYCIMYVFRYSLKTVILHLKIFCIHGCLATEVSVEHWYSFSKSQLRFLLFSL